ncbi:MAG: hypothetical protein LC797_24860, partial [Chloroflexi bacterium]|nr:hypothetical protein [Chloroflexota bacterium]
MTVRTRMPARARRSAAPGSVRVWLAGLVVLALAIPIGSSVFGLYDRLLHWGKLVHGVEAFLVALVVGLLVLAWRDRAAIDLTEQLSVLLTIFCGIFFNVVWEILEFVVDWVRSADLQKSNSDTMTDLLWGDVGAVVGAVLAARAYCHWVNADQREQLGGVAEWLVKGPSRVLDRHGLLVSIVVGVL